MNTAVIHQSVGQASTVSHASLMNELQAKHDLIVDLIGGRSVNFADIPVHGNIGDLLIMQGTFRFMEKNRIPCRLSAAYFNYSPSWLGKDEVLLLQGGGNLGDLYPGPQLFRERCVERSKDNRIIILPQTIHFSDEKNQRKCEKIFSKHPDLHICVRDISSYNQALRMTSNVYLLPDMAHHLWPLHRTAPITGKHLGIFRVDGESAGTVNHVCDYKTDWPRLVGRGRARLIRTGHQLSEAFHQTGLDRLTVAGQSEIWQRYSDTLVNEAVRLFSSYKKITTDRLHGHILACVMNIENTVLDNSYGKNFGYFNAWTGSSDIVKAQVTDRAARVL
jgi:pyruvyl transferase EpsO